MPTDTDALIEAGKRLDIRLTELPEFSEQIQLLEIGRYLRKTLNKGPLKEALVGALNSLSVYHLTLSEFAKAIRTGSLNASYCRAITEKALKDYQDFAALRKAANDLDSLRKDLSFAGVNDELKRVLFTRFYPKRTIAEIQQAKSDHEEQDFILLSLLGFLSAENKFYRLTSLGREFLEENSEAYFETSGRVRRWLTTRSVSGGRTLAGWIGSGVIGLLLSAWFGG